MTEDQLLLLFGRPNEDLVDGDMPWTGHDVFDRIGDVACVESLNGAETLPYSLQDLRAIVARELGGDRSGLDERHSKMTLRYF